MFKVLKTVEQYEEALARVEILLDIDPQMGTDESDELELLTLLINDYGKTHFPIDPPDSIEIVG